MTVTLAVPAVADVESSTSEEPAPAATGFTGLAQPRGVSEARAFTRSYSQALARNGSCPIESGVIARLADNECAHGRLAFDRTPPCGCFTAEGNCVGSPHYGTAVGPAITTEEVSELLATEVPSNGEAPFGLKADGTPRKRPYPAWLNDQAKRDAATAKRTSKPRKRADARPVLSAAEANALGTAQRIASEIAAEEKRLAGVVGELRDQAAKLDAAVQAAEQEHERVAAALAALRG